MPLGIEASLGGRSSHIGVRAGPRLRLRAGVFAGVYPLNPTALFDRDPERTKRRRGSFVSSLELGWSD